MRTAFELSLRPKPVSRYIERRAAPPLVHEAMIVISRRSCDTNANLGDRQESGISIESRTQTPQSMPNKNANRQFDLLRRLAANCDVNRLAVELGPWVLVDFAARFQTVKEQKLVSRLRDVTRIRELHAACC